VWVRSEAGWIPIEELQAGMMPREKFRREDWTAVPCWIGVDLAEVLDVMAKAILFKLEAKDKPTRYVALVTLYLPETTIEKSPIAQYPGWVAEEFIESTLGDVADYSRLEADLLADVAELNVQEICFDRSLAAAVMQSLREALKSDEPPIVVVRQTVDVMDPAMRAIERTVALKTFSYVENPALEWMFSNVVVFLNERDEKTPRKAGGKDSPNKIDGVVAILDAMSRAYSPEPDPVSAYATHRLVVV
jgi:phage terminase large subunit-like protein